MHKDGSVSKKYDPSAKWRFGACIALDFRFTKLTPLESLEPC